MTLLYGNTTEDDILLKRQLDDLAEMHPTRFAVYYTVSKPSPGWDPGMGRGRITADMLQMVLPRPGPTTVVTVCGPPGFTDNLCGAHTPLTPEEMAQLTDHQKEMRAKSAGRVDGGLLGKLGYPVENTYVLD